MIGIARTTRPGCLTFACARHRGALRCGRSSGCLYRELYCGFTVAHFHEQLGKRHNYTLGYTVTKLHLHRSGLVTPAKTRSAHRKKRPPRGHECCTRRLDARLAGGRRRQAGPGGNEASIISRSRATTGATSAAAYPLQSDKVDRSRMTPCRARICAWRYSGR